jgi:hypothetical protein
MAMQKAVVGTIAAVAVVLMMTSVFAYLTANRSVPNSGEIKGVNVSVYQDSACTQPLTSWTWGVMDPGTSAVKTMYVKNEGNAPMILSLTTTTWAPSSASTYITVTWNREGTGVNAGSNVKADVTLSVSPSTAGITGFTFTMVITGTG